MRGGNAYSVDVLNREGAKSAKDTKKAEILATDKHR